MSRQSVGTWEMLSDSLFRLNWECIARNIRKKMHQQTPSVCSRFRGLYMSTNLSSPFPSTSPSLTSSHSLICSLALECWPCFSTESRALWCTSAWVSSWMLSPPSELIQLSSQTGLSPYHTTHTAFSLPTALCTPGVCHVLYIFLPEVMSLFWTAVPG